MLLNNKNEEMKKYVWQLSDLLRGMGMSRNHVLIVLLSYVFKQTNKLNNPCDLAYNQMIDFLMESDKEIAEIAAEYLTNEIWEKVKDIGVNYTDEFFDQVILNDSLFDMNGRFEYSTPQSIINLSLKLLGNMTDKKVCDFCCGTGGFLVNSYLANNEGNYFGVDINVEAINICKIKNKILGNKMDIFIGSMFEESDNKYDIIFSNYPFGLDSKTLVDYIKSRKDIYPRLNKRSSDWVFNCKIIEELNENGKAVVIMTNGSVSNITDMKIKKYFIENGYIETIISLPANLFNSTTIPTTLMVLSKNNKKVRMVDASRQYQQERRRNIMSDENIDNILQSVHSDTEISIVVSNEEIIENDANLNPRRYIDKPIEYQNGVALETVIKSITRGAPCKASELDAISSKSETDYQYLMLSNIQDGYIKDELPCITKIEEKYERYCIKNNSLVISKMGAPIKMAVVHVDEHKQVLANGNLYVIELDETKVNPYYLKAFFNSEEGLNALNRIMVGATLPSIPVNELKTLTIPLPSLEIQNEIAKNYINALDEIKILNLKLERAKNKLNQIYSESEVN